MKLSKKKEKELKAKKISNIALVIFFIFYVWAPIGKIIDHDSSIIETIEALAVVFNALLINRYIGLGLSIFSYLKYKTIYSKKVMILCIVLQIISLIALSIWASNFDLSIDG